MLKLRTIPAAPREETSFSNSQDTFTLFYAGLSLRGWVAYAGS